MALHQLETDYLIIGAGAVGMAFADVLVSETDANILIVDNHHKPGGHWNDAYSFVTLHQPSAFYGVSSLELASGKKDEVGLNKGLMELATGDEVMSYFNNVMQHRFLPSGRVQYFPMCQYEGDKKFKALLSDNEYEVTVNKKIVDATHFKTSVPSTHTRNYTSADDIEIRPLNDLPKIKSQYDEYVVVGGGKTGIDAVMWMIENQIDPDKISWIMPRDGWLINRANTQPAKEYFLDAFGAQVSQSEAIAQSSSLDELFDRLEETECLLRIDESVKPTMFHGATVSKDEIALLQRVSNVVRKGRVTQIEKGLVTLEQGEMKTADNTLYIDCSARAVPHEEIKPVFQGELITPQTVRVVQPVFSAAFIAHIEATIEDEATKNEICTVVPLPNHAEDWLRVNAAQMQNQFVWSKVPGLREWLISNRLDGFTALTVPDENTTPAELEVLGKLKAAIPAAVKNLPNLMGEVMAIRATRA
ncbi:MAG: NAD(P)-binding protein [Pseudomonadota bacterium]